MLCLAAVCWGLGFYAQRISIVEVSPLTSTAARFVIAAPVAVAALVWCARRGIRIPWRAGAVLGVLLYIAFAMQTVAMEYTPVSRVALLTGLYVVFTPMLQPFFKLGRPTPVQVVAAIVAVLGTLLLVGVVGDDTATSTPPNIGDALTLGMAVLCAVMVLLIGRWTHEHPVALNAVQIAVMCVVSVLVTGVVEGSAALGVLSTSFNTWASLVYLAVFSTIAAFTLQMMGQRHLSPAPASVIMLLETPVGVIAAVLLLGEAMAGLQWLGAAIALAAVVVSVVGEHRNGT